MKLIPFLSLLVIFTISKTYGQGTKVGIINNHDLISTNNTLGLFDSQGNEIIKPGTYSSISYDEEAQLYRCYIGKQFEIWFEKTGKLTSDYLFSTLYSFDYDRYKVKSKSGYGVIDNKQLIIPPIYDKIVAESESYFECCINYVVYKNGKKGVYAGNKLMIEPKYDEIQRLDYLEGFFLLKNNKKFGLASLQGDMVKVHLKTNYSSIEPLDDYYENDFLFLLSENSQFGIFSAREDSIVLPVKYDLKGWEKKEPLTEYDAYVIEIKSTSGKSYLLLNLENPGKHLVVAEVVHIDQYDPMVIIKNFAGKFQFVSLEYSVDLQPREFDDVKINPKFIGFKVDGKWGMTDSYGNVYFEPEYETYDDLVEEVSRGEY